MKVRVKSLGLRDPLDVDVDACERETIKKMDDSLPTCSVRCGISARDSV